jgi:hypothetical protein
MFRFYHAENKRALVESVAKTAPVGPMKFRIAQKIPPGGWMVEFGNGTERNGFFSLEMVQKALGLFSAKPGLMAEVPKTTTKAWVAARLGRTGFVILD